MDLRVALYFSIGVTLAQFSHTVYAAIRFKNKRVRVFEYFLPWFEREKTPDELNSRLLSWIPGSTSEATRPSELPEFQQSLDAVPDRFRGLFRILGLQATNLYYCSLLSFIYGFISFLLLATFPFQFKSWLLVVGFIGILLILVSFSFLAVGSSLALLVIEGNLIYNSFTLLALLNGIVFETTALTLFQFGAIIFVSSLIFWLNFQRDKGFLDYGSFSPAYFIIINIIYGEFTIILLWLMSTA